MEGRGLQGLPQGPGQVLGWPMVRQDSCSPPNVKAPGGGLSVGRSDRAGQPRVGRRSGGMGVGAGMAVVRIGRIPRALRAVQGPGSAFCIEWLADMQCRQAHRCGHPRRLVSFKIGLRIQNPLHRNPIPAATLPPTPFPWCLSLGLTGYLTHTGLGPGTQRPTHPHTHTHTHTCPACRQASHPPSSTQEAAYRGEGRGHLVWENPAWKNSLRPIAPLHNFPSTFFWKSWSSFVTSVKQYR